MSFSLIWKFGCFLNVCTSMSITIINARNESFFLKKTKVVEVTVLHALTLVTFAVS